MGRVGNKYTSSHLQVDSTLFDRVMLMLMLMLMLRNSVDHPETNWSSMNILVSELLHYQERMEKCESGSSVFQNTSCNTLLDFGYKSVVKQFIYS